jgi:hypothetical protein
MDLLVAAVRTADERHTTMTACGKTDEETSDAAKRLGRGV